MLFVKKRGFKTRGGDDVVAGNIWRAPPALLAAGPARHVVNVGPVLQSDARRLLRLPGVVPVVAPLLPLARLRVGVALALPLGLDRAARLDDGEPELVAGVVRAGGQRTVRPDGYKHGYTKIIQSGPGLHLRYKVKVMHP